jgi:radical SAM-linked protein
MMRAMERVAARADLPLAYSQGFNPRAVMSLAAPRPVGLATDDDLLVLSLTDPLDAETILQRLTDASPPTGLTFTAARPLVGKAGPQARRVDYELALTDDEAPRVQSRAEALAGQDSWFVQRPPKPVSPGRKRPRRPAEPKTVDLRPLIVELGVTHRTARWTQQTVGSQTARPADVLRLLELDERAAIARTSRAAVTWCLGDDTQDIRSDRISDG